MIDIQLSSSGDLVINKTKEGGYEFEIDRNPALNLLKRVVQTPKGYISRCVLDKEGLRLIDKELGSELYKELSEGLTINFISRIRNHILKSIKEIDMKVNIVDIRVSVTGLQTVGIDIHFEDDIKVNLDIPL